MSEQQASGVMVTPDYDEVEVIKGEEHKVDGVYRFSPFTAPGDRSGISKQRVEEDNVDSLRFSDWFVSLNASRT